MTAFISCRTTQSFSGKTERWIGSGKERENKSGAFKMSGRNKRRRERATGLWLYEGGMGYRQKKQQQQKMPVYHIRPSATNCLVSMHVSFICLVALPTVKFLLVHDICSITYKAQDAILADIVNNLHWPVINTLVQYDRSFSQC